MVDKWNDIIENSKTGYSALIDVNMWLGKATLDAYVPVSASGVREPDRDLIFQKVWHWSFRLRLRRPGREG